jgi:hypothetical protein
VVVVLSTEFITKPYPMEELQLLMERHRQGSEAVLLPVFLTASYEDIGDKGRQYSEARKHLAAQQADQTFQWGDYLESLCALAEPNEGGAQVPGDEGVVTKLRAAQLGQYARDLGDIAGVTAFRPDQVWCHARLLHRT